MKSSKLILVLQGGPFRPVFKKEVKRMMGSKRALVGTVWCCWAPLGAPGWILNRVLTYPGFDLSEF